MNNEFEKEKSIDPQQLDLECVRQTDLFFKYAHQSVDAQVEVDRAKMRLEVVEAGLELAIRKDPEQFGLIKPTESAIKAAVRLDNKYSNALERYINAKREAKLLEIAVDTMDQKKRMLENLITLHGQQYFAGPSVPRDLVAAWKEGQEQSEQSLNERQRARTRRRGEQR